MVNGRTPVGDAKVSQLFRRVNDSCFDDTTLPVYRGACLNQPLGALVFFSGQTGDCWRDCRL